MAPNEWFETKGSKPEIRVPPKRRHFAVWTKAPKTCPFLRAKRAVKEPGSLEGRGDRRPSRPVWAAAQGVDLEVEFKSGLRAAAAAAQACQTLGCYPNPLFKSLNSNSRSWARRPHWPKGF